MGKKRRKEIKDGGEDGWRLSFGGRKRGSNTILKRGEKWKEMSDKEKIKENKGEMEIRHFRLMR